MCEDTLKASFSDGLKVFSKWFINQKNKYGVIYEDGSLKKGWVQYVYKVIKENVFITKKVLWTL